MRDWLQIVLFDWGIIGREWSVCGVCFRVSEENCAVGEIAQLVVRLSRVSTAANRLERRANWDMHERESKRAAALVVVAERGGQSRKRWGVAPGRSARVQKRLSARCAATRTRAMQSVKLGAPYSGRCRARSGGCEGLEVLERAPVSTHAFHSPQPPDPHARRLTLEARHALEARGGAGDHDRAARRLGSRGARADAPRLVGKDGSHGEWLLCVCARGDSGIEGLVDRRVGGVWRGAQRLNSLFAEAAPNTSSGSPEPGRGCFDSWFYYLSNARYWPGAISRLCILTYSTAFHCAHSCPLRERPTTSRTIGSFWIVFLHNCATRGQSPRKGRPVSQSELRNRPESRPPPSG